MHVGDITYTVQVHEEAASFWAEVVELPGCFASGDTMDELWEGLAEAISVYLSVPGSMAHAKMVDAQPHQNNEYKVLVSQ